MKEKENPSRRKFLKVATVVIAATTLDAAFNPSLLATEQLKPNPTANSTPNLTNEPVSSGPKIYSGFGISEYSSDAIQQMENTTQLNFPLALTFHAWANGDIDQSLLTELSAHGKTPIITWEPWDPTKGEGAEQPDYKLSKIAQGDFDEYIRRNALIIKEHEQPIFLRFAHEMDGDWFPWGGTVNGNKPQDYVDAWNHTHDIFDEVGARNVTWLWSPDGFGGEDDPGMEAYLPDKDKFDWAGFTGFNWGTAQRWKSWQSLSSIIEHVYPELTSLTDKPIMIAETGSTEVGGNKAKWIEKGYQDLPNFPRINAVVWYNINKKIHTDWRIESSPQSLEAFKEATEHEIFNANTVKTKNGKIIPYE